MSYLIPLICAIASLLRVSAENPIQPPAEGVMIWPEYEPDEFQEREWSEVV